MNTTLTTMLRIQKLSPDAQIPSRATPGSVGYDLYSTSDYMIPPSSRSVISTGIAIKLPPNTYGRIAPRSGLAVKNGLTVGAGVIDRDYTGEIKVILFNHDQKALWLDQDIVLVNLFSRGVKHQMSR